ncbi:cupin domain-containing protein [Bifidobacterium sp. ESL0822]|uniref:cupin domain-containing protein n=1 Tax=Bifidobacterium sp. ESL0822 TaxID=3448585 RepID=UPI0040417C69
MWNTRQAKSPSPPGHFNRWHTHPDGQLLLVTAGLGWEQEGEQIPRQLKPGDAVFRPAGVRHRHGVSKNSSMTHVAITPTLNSQSPVKWLDFPISWQP